MNEEFYKLLKEAYDVLKDQEQCHYDHTIENIIEEEDWKLIALWVLLKSMLEDRYLI